MPATSVSFDTTAPKLSSVSGVSFGQLATSSGFTSREGLVGEAQPVRRQLAISIDSVGAYLTFDLVLYGGVPNL
jgi:hypothetical protein